MQDRVQHHLQQVVHLADLLLHCRMRLAQRQPLNLQGGAFGY